MSSSGDLGGDSISVICGPTAAGKSRLALRIAELERVAIVSADSRQIYRGFDIGTAKPTPDERARVPHFGIDIADPAERYSASMWAQSAGEWIAGARASALAPLVVGGTGFYLRALFDPLFEAPTLDPDKRAALAAELEPLSVDELRRYCLAIDPSLAHLGRTQLLRAIETATLTGERLSDLQRTRMRAPRFTARYLVVDPGAVLAARIERRVREMLSLGWVEEGRRLAKVVPSTAPAWNATGYATVRRLADGDATYEDAMQRIVIDTRRYAKRQRTWFRHQLPARLVTRIDPDAADADERAAAWWRAGDRR